MTRELARQTIEHENEIFERLEDAVLNKNKVGVPIGLVALHLRTVAFKSGDACIPCFVALRSNKKRIH